MSSWVLGLVKPEQMLTSVHDSGLPRYRCTIKTANGGKGNINVLVLYCMGDSVHREGDGPWRKKAVELIVWSLGNTHPRWLESGGMETREAAEGHRPDYSAFRGWVVQNSCPSVFKCSHGCRPEHYSSITPYKKKKKTWYILASENIIIIIKSNYF